MGRRLLYGLVVLLVVLGVAFFAGKYYLSSRLTPQVATRLGSALGMPVEVAGTDVGISGGSELQDVRIYEPAATPGANPPAAGRRPDDKPWFRVGKVTADVSILGILRGETRPKWVRLTGAAITLRFDKDDKLLTRLPSPRPTEAALPEIAIDEGSLTIEQEGRDPFVLNGIRAAFDPAGKVLDVKGSVNDQQWGSWQLGGQADPSTGGVRLSLETPSADVTMDKLTKLPFVPRSVWKQVDAEGKTSAKVDLQLSRGEGPDHYRVDLMPEGAKIRVPSIDLNADDVRGRVTVDDKLVTLSNVTGRAAEGTLFVGGTLDFRPDPTGIDLGVRTQDVLVQRLPKSWDLPRGLDGKLTGTADLRLRLTDPVQTQGSTGEGVVTGVTVLGLGKGEARLYLHAGPGRFSFRREPPQRTSGVTPPARPAQPVAIERAKEKPSPAVASVLDGVSNGLNALTGVVTATAATGLRRLKQVDQPPPGKPPSYFESNLSLQDVDLGELVRRAKVSLPFSLEGKLSFQLNIGFPLDTPRDFKAYRFRGDVRMPRLVVAGLPFANVKARVRYADGLLTLDSVQGEIPTPDAQPGTFDGTAKYQLTPAGDLSAALRVERVPLAVMARLLPNAGDAGGNLSGNVQFRSTGGKLSDPNSWEGDATLRSDQARAYGMAVKDFVAAVSVTRGRLTLNDLKGSVAGAALTGRGTLGLSGTYPVDADLTVPAFNLALLQFIDPAFRPPVPVAGRVDLTARLKGTLRPRALGVSGTARTSDLTVAGARVDALSFRFAVEPARVAVSDLKAELFRGTVTGTVTLPLRPTEAGDFALKIAGVDAAALGKGFPAFPVTLEGAVSGTLTGKLPPAKDGSRETTADVELSAPDLVLQGIPTQRLRGNLTYRAGTGSYHLEGEVAGGTFKLDGPLPPRPAAEGNQRPAAQGPSPQTGTLRLQNVRLGRLAAVRWRDVSPLLGTLDSDLTFGFTGPNRELTGRGVFAVTRLRWGDAPLTDRLQGEVRLTPSGLRVGDVSGVLGTGEVRLNGGFNFGRDGRGYLNVELYHADAVRLLAPFPGLAGLASGPVDLSLHFSGGRELRGWGQALLIRGRVLGVEVSDWRVPLEFSFIAGVGGQLDVRESSAQVAYGRAQGRANVTWGDTTRLEGSVRFFDADVRTLLGRESRAANYTGGRLNGTLDFNADQFRSANDLNATLSATLGQAEASNMPVLPQIVPFLGLVGGAGSTRFQTGEIRGRLAHGVFHIQRFTLTGSVLQLIFEGDVTLAGRLDLEVTAGSGNFGVNARGFQLLGLRLPAIGPLPLTLIVDASAFLANRIVHLRVTGTVDNPVVRVEPTALLSQEAVRYFLSRTGLPITP